MTDVRNDTIEVDDYQVWSSTESADEMVETHKPKSEDGGAPKKVGKDGKAVEAKEEKPEKKSKVSEAASELGKRGGKASAEKRAAAKDKAEDEPEGDDEKEPEKKAEEPEKPEEQEKTGEEPEKEAAEATETEPEKAAKPRHDMQARLRQLAAARQAEAERAERAEARAREMEDRVTRLERGERRPEAGDQRQAPQMGAQEDDPKPRIDDYPTHEEYLDARDEWNKRRWTREIAQEAELRQEAHQHARQYADGIRGQVEAHHNRVQAALKADPTLSERVDPRLAYPPTFALEKGQEPGPFNYFANEVVRSDRGIEVMAYMSERPDLVAAMFQDAKQAFSLGHDVKSCHENAQREIQRHFLRAELLLDKPAGPQPVTPRPAPSNAKPPLKPVPTSAVVSDDERAFADNTDYDDHVAMWNARDKAAGRRR